MSELKCCPFCGGEAELHSVDIGSSTDFFISCKECGCKQSGSISRKAVIESWNARKPMDNIMEKLEKELLTSQSAHVGAASGMCGFLASGYSGEISAYKEAINIVKQEINNGENNT